jgi:iron(III) transport system ATP-binding protein
MSNTLTLQNIAKSFGNNKVVNQVCLTINEGEHIALLGESGSGKTTLLRIIAGLEKADNGSVDFANQTWQNNRVWVAPEKRNIGFVFQDYALFPHLTVAQNIVFGAKTSKADLQHTLTQFELNGFANRYPHELSGGQQQRVAIARSVIRKPSLLLLDEPFSNLDEGLKDQLRNSMRTTLKQLNITSILVTHDVNDAFMVCDKIALLNHGNIVQYNTPQHLYKNPSNQWAAQFFGSLNCLTINGVPLYFRPEHVNFNPTSDLKATVVACQFAGAHYNLTLQQSTSTFTVKHQEALPIGSNFPFEITQTLSWHD